MRFPPKLTIYISKFHNFCFLAKIVYAARKSTHMCRIRDVSFTDTRDLRTNSLRCLNALFVHMQSANTSNTKQTFARVYILNECMFFAHICGIRKSALVALCLLALYVRCVHNKDYIPLELFCYIYTFTIYIYVRTHMNLFKM